MDETRQLYIISGCNGAGKTTASYTVLPEILLCKEFVNADEIAKGLSPFNPESMAIEAGRLMLKRINELLAAKVSFSIETTLATRSYTRLIQRAQNARYKVSLIYFWLNSPELAVNRVLRPHFSGIGLSADCHHEPIRYWTWLLYTGGRRTVQPGTRPRAGKTWSYTERFLYLPSRSGRTLRMP